MRRVSRILDKFEEAKRQKRAVVVPYLTVGFPSLEVSEVLFKELAEAGADILELGIPFSDPLADGPIIQHSSQVALSQGVTVENVFEMVKSLREITAVPLILMAYYNLFYHYGLEEFVARATKVGVDGVIVPDLPPEEGEDWLKAARGKLETIFLLAPTSSEERIKKVAGVSNSFIYCVSLAGVTGVREKLSSVLPQFVSRVRSKTDKPLAVGFGVSTPAQAGEVAKLADGVIIGSALIKLVSEEKVAKDQLAKARELVTQVCQAVAS